MLMMKLQWLIVLTLFVHNAWAYSLYDELDDDNLWRRETPSTENEGKPECKKDILVLWDNSNSISPHYEDVFKFMKKLIRNKDLNVGEDGTHLGFITFSDGQSLDPRRAEQTKALKKYTRVLLKVGEIKDPEKIIDNLSGYDYDKDLSGEKTYTGSAFMLAEEEFNEKSPKNHRDGIDDIILLFTDGRPNPDFTTKEHKNRRNKEADQTKPADKASKTLKENNVTIIGLAGGKEENIRDFRSYIKRWSSPNQVFESKLDELPNLIDQLVEDFCKTGTKPCGCEGNSSTVQYVQDSESKLLINWKKPSLNCGDGVFVPEPKVHPEGTESPKEFGIGRHEITYTFSPSSGGKNRPSVECSVGVNIDLCFCPSPRVVSAVIPLGDSRAFAEWSEPTPLGECKFVPSPFNPQSSGWFRAGRHELTYDYTHTTELHSYTMHCPVTIYVKETKPCVCEGTSSTVQYVQDSESKVLINWEKPRLNCGDGVVVPEPKVHPERAESPMEFGPGRYKITYKFSPSSGGKKRPSVECSVRVNIDLCFCPSPQVVNVEVTPGESTAIAKWSEPTPLGDCEFVPSPSNPREPSGRFRAGRHELTYAYKHTTEMHSYTMHCPVTIYVKGQFCSAIAFNPETQICCCGKVREIAFGDMCCGQENYVLHEKTCCPGDKLVLNEEECS